MMRLPRRRFLTALTGAAAAGVAAPIAARAATASSTIDATALGVRPNAAEDQSTILQRAIDHAAAAGAVLNLPAGVYRGGGLQLPSFAAIAGVPGATRIVMTSGPSLLAATGSEQVSLRGLILD